MKQQIKYTLSRAGLFPKLDLMRHFYEISRWVSNGTVGVLPAPAKRLTLSAYLHRFNLTRFIETGTYLGDTLAYIAHDKAVECTSIELAERYYLEAKRRFVSYSNVTLLHGDSAMLLSERVLLLQEPALFWLDGHYSGGSTAKGISDTPITAELNAILASPIRSHVILIDDARCFTGSDGYPYLDEILKQVRDNSDYAVEISGDIIRLTPPKV